MSKYNLQNIRLYFETRLSVEEQAFFAKRLSFLTRAGIPIVDSLYMLRQQAKSNSMQRILDHTIESVSEGNTLSKSLTQFPSIFNKTTVHIISIGESTGKLTESLDHLSVELRKKQELRKKIMSAFLYPGILLIATCAIIIFLIVFLFPKILPVFMSMHIALPLSTRILLFVNHVFVHFGFLILIIIILCISTLIVLYKNVRSVKKICTRAVLRVPILRNIITYYNLANFSRTTQILLQSGLTLSESLPIIIQGTKNSVYAEAYQLILEDIVQGEPISKLLQKYPSLFPATVYQIISIGEKSGSLEHSFAYINDFYESELNDTTKNISQLIEPVLMIVIGLLIGFIAISIISPIYGITQNIR